MLLKLVSEYLEDINYHRSSHRIYPREVFFFKEPVQITGKVDQNSRSHALLAMTRNDLAGSDIKLLARSHKLISIKLVYTDTGFGVGQVALNLLPQDELTDDDKEVLIAWNKFKGCHRVQHMLRFGELQVLKEK